MPRYVQQVSLNLQSVEIAATFSKAAATFSKAAVQPFPKLLQAGPRDVFSRLQPFPKLNFIYAAFLHVLHGPGQEEVE